MPVRIARGALAVMAASVAYVAVARAETQAWDRTIARVAPASAAMQMGQVGGVDSGGRESI